MNFGVTILRNLIPAYANGMQRKAEDATAKAALDIEADWKMNIQAAGLIDTGAYLNSVQARRQGPADWIVSTGLSDPPYPYYLEYGTSRGIRPYGVATKAAEDNRERFRMAISQILGDVG